MAKPAPQRSISLKIPQDSWLAAKRAALGSNLSLKAYLARWLAMAKPLPADDKATASSPGQDGPHPDRPPADPLTYPDAAGGPGS